MALTVLKLMRFTRKTTLHPQQSTYNLLIQLIGCHFELLPLCIFIPKKGVDLKDLIDGARKFLVPFRRYYFCIFLLENIIRV